MITRKRIRWFFLIIALGVFAAPYLVNLDMIRTRIESRINESQGITSRIGSLSWRWFPSPGLALRDMSLSHPMGHALIREANLYPEWLHLFKGSLALRSIRIVEPDIRLKALDSLATRLHSIKKDKPQPRSFYSGHIRVSVARGRLSVPWSGSFDVLKQTTPPPEFTNITGSLDVWENRLSLTGRMASSYADTCRLTLDLGIDESATMRWDLAARVQTASYKPIRSILLHVFPDNQTVRGICGQMISDGLIQTYAFGFNGTTAQWSDISRMEATAQVSQVVFHIPGTGLALENTSGTFYLTKGILEGRDLSTTFGASTGHNGTFSLDMGNTERPPFSLAMDLSADLSDLPPVFDAFLPDGDVKGDIAALTDLKGTANGRLTLSGDLPQLDYGLFVQDISASCFFHRINQPVTILNAALTVSPTGLSWNGLAADIGLQRIHNSSGRLDWEHAPALDITSLSATLDSHELYPYLVSDQTLGSRLEPLVSAVRGPLDIRSLSVKGPLSDPKALTFNGQLSTMGVTFESPSLPQPLTLISPGIRFTENTLESRSLTARMGDQMLRVSASWKPGNAHADLYGTVRPSSASFLKETGLIPDAIFPRLPCDLDPLSLSWSGETLSVRGLIIHGDDKALPMTTRLDITVKPDVIVIRHLYIDDGTQYADVIAGIPKDLQSGEIHVSLHGGVNGASLNRIIDNNRLPKGNLSGQADLVYPLDKSKPPLLTGDLQITDLDIDLDEKSGLSLSRCSVRGQGKQAGFDLDGLTLSRPNGLSSSFQSLAGDLVFLPGPETDVALSSGNICGIDLTGDIHLPSLAMVMQLGTGGTVPVSFHTITTCLGLKETAISGDVTCHASIRGTPDMITQGTITLRARNGVIQKAKLFSKVIALLDLTELFKANPVKNLLSDGYRYETMDLEATIKGHNLHITRAQIIGAGINFYATGHVDLKNMSLDLYVLASPFKTVDSIVNRIPVIGKVVGGKNKSILSVPVKVEGHMDNPQTRILPKSVANVSSGILDAFVSTFKLPFQLSSETKGTSP